MNKIVLATSQQIKSIVEFADRQFEVDFYKLQPKLYLSNLGNNYIYQVDGQIAGLISTYESAINQLKTLSVGTVCVDRQYRNNGIMSQMFDYLQANVFNDYDLIFLVGKKERYEHFNFAKAATSLNIEFVKSRFKSQASVTEVVDSRYNDRLYGLFDNHCKRSGKDFFTILQTNYSKVYLIEIGGKSSYACVGKGDELLEVCGQLDVVDVANELMIYLALSKIIYICSNDDKSRCLIERCNKYSLQTYGNIKINGKTVEEVYRLMDYEHFGLNAQFIVPPSMFTIDGI